MGFKGMITEGAKHVLGWKSPNYLYYNTINPKLKVLLKNFKLSDDIAFRFSNEGWDEYPLTAAKYVDWLSNLDEKEETINLFMDYETFGEHQWEETGIFKFMKNLPEQILKHPHNHFVLPSEAVKFYDAKAEIDMHNFVSWADIERDLSAWLGNNMQESAFQQLYLLEKEIIESGDEKLIEDWRKLQTSDHFYYMCTKWFSDGDVHKYFNPYESPYDSFIAFMNIINDLKYRIKNLGIDSIEMNNVNNKNNVNKKLNLFI